MSLIRAALAGRLPASVEFSATVTSSPRFFTGTTTHARHEAFDVLSADGVRLEVVDNVDLAPPVDVRPGDRVSVHGDLVEDRQHRPVVHWTHHDPAGRHADGWIELDGRRYA